jgi:hypothetical protein
MLLLLFCIRLSLSLGIFGHLIRFMPNFLIRFFRFSLEFLGHFVGLGLDLVGASLQFLFGLLPLLRLVVGV